MDGWGPLRASVVDPLQVESFATGCAAALVGGGRPRRSLGTDADVGALRARWHRPGAGCGLPGPPSRRSRGAEPLAAPDGLAAGARAVVGRGPRPGGPARVVGRWIQHCGRSVARGRSPVLPGCWRPRRLRGGAGVARVRAGRLPDAPPPCLRRCVRALWTLWHLALFITGSLQNEPGPWWHRFSLCCQHSWRRRSSTSGSTRPAVGASWSSSRCMPWAMPLRRRCRSTGPKAVETTVTVLLAVIAGGCCTGHPRRRSDEGCSADLTARRDAVRLVLAIGARIGDVRCAPACDPEPPRQTMSIGYRHPSPPGSPQTGQQARRTDTAPRRRTARSSGVPGARHDGHRP